MIKNNLITCVCFYPAVAIATYVAPLDKWLKTEIWSGIQGLFECSNGGR